MKGSREEVKERTNKERVKGERKIKNETGKEKETEILKGNV